MKEYAILSKDQVVALLRDMTDGFESGATDEGSCEILLPPYTASKDFYDNLMADEMKGWYEWHEDHSEAYWRLSRDAPRDRFMVRMSYRIGRDNGQGGLRLINSETMPATRPANSDVRPSR